MTCVAYPNVCIIQGQTYRQIFTADGDWSGAECRGQIRDNWLNLDGTIKAVFEFGVLTYDAETDLTTVEGVVSHQQTTLLPATKYQGTGIQTVKNSLVYDIEIELGDNVFKLAPGYVQVIPEVSDDSVIYDPPVIWDGGIDSIELTETNGLVDTYTIWGDADKTINLGTFDVKNSEGVGIESADYDSLTGVLTFVYTDGSEFSTEDIRGEHGDDGVGIQSTEYNPLTGILTFTFTDNSEFTTDDLRADLDSATIKTRYELNDDTNAFTDAEKTKLSGLNATDYATAAQGLLAESALQPDDVDLSPYALSSEVSIALGDKVDKVTGKGLSTEDYTSAEKTKLGNLVLPETLTDKALYYYDTNSGLFKPVGIGTLGQTLIAQPANNPPYQWAAPSGVLSNPVPIVFQSIQTVIYNQGGNSTMNNGAFNTFTLTADGTGTTIAHSNVPSAGNRYGFELHLTWTSGTITWPASWTKGDSKPVDLGNYIISGISLDGGVTFKIIVLVE